MGQLARLLRIFGYVILVTIVVAWGGLAAFRWYIRTPHTPRPLFHSWEQHDMGFWRWKMWGPVQDYYGNVLYYDVELNMIVVIISPDGYSTSSLAEDIRPDGATLFVGSKAETVVEPAPDTLILTVPGTHREEMHLRPGGGSAVRAYVDSHMFYVDEGKTVAVALKEAVSPAELDHISSMLAQPKQE